MCLLCLRMYKGSDQDSNEDFFVFDFTDTLNGEYYIYFE